MNTTVPVETGKYRNTGSIFGSFGRENINHFKIYENKGDADTIYI